jgi:hypothetical protein
MKEQIESIIQQYCESLKSLDTNKNISQVVKSIDTLTQDTYAKIYALRDGRKNGTYESMSKKHGHCC